MDNLTSVLSEVLTLVEHFGTFDLLLLVITLLILWQQHSLRRKVSQLGNEVDQLHQRTERLLLILLNADRNVQVSKQEPSFAAGESADIVPLKTLPTAR
jgi:hypothetical protein